MDFSQLSFSALEWIFLIIGGLIIFVTMIQQSKSDGASGALMGGGLNLFTETKQRGIEKIISQATIYLGIAFILVAIIIKMK